MELLIKPLTPSLSGGFLSFFDGPAFSDNPEWAGCYCSFYHISGEEWESRSAKDNRAFAADAIKKGAMRGYLAYLNGEPVGWVNANGRSNFARLAENPDLPEGDRILSVVCFIVAYGYRGRGVASLLLSAAVEGAKKDGYDYVEAYPYKDTSTPALCYHGTLAMYEKAGFKTVADAQGYWVVRKELGRV